LGAESPDTPPDAPPAAPPQIVVEPEVAAPAMASDPRPTLYSELKRRRVLRGIGVYALIAFGVLQALWVILPALGLPAWLMPATIGAAVAGLPFAITLGWLFDLQPDGVRPEHAPDHVGILEAPRRWPRLLAIVGVAIVLAIVSLGAYLRFFPSDAF
jgi:hypothetical protein